MHAPTILALLTAATTALAAPATSKSNSDSDSDPASPASPSPALFINTSSPQTLPGTWTITSYKKTCSQDDKSCAITFSIDTHAAPKSAITICTIQVSNPNGFAGRTSYNEKICDGPAGKFAVSSSWSGQFGAEKGFTTLSVVDHLKKLIIWPGYADFEVENGQVVVPDKSYLPVALPEGYQVL